MSGEARAFRVSRRKHAHEIARARRPRRKGASSSSFRHIAGTRPAPPSPGPRRCRPGLTAGEFRRVLHGLRLGHSLHSFVLPAGSARPAQTLSAARSVPFAFDRLSATCFVGRRIPTVDRNPALEARALAGRLSPKTRFSGKCSSSCVANVIQVPPASRQEQVHRYANVSTRLTTAATKDPSANCQQDACATIYCFSGATCRPKLRHENKRISTAAPERVARDRPIPSPSRIRQPR